MGFIRAWLRGNAFVDHNPAFAQLFSLATIRNVVEFGLGDGTEYFLNNAEWVKSMEIASQRSGAASKLWIEKCREKYKTFSNWRPEFMVCDDLIEAADILALQQKIHPAMVDKSYLQSLAKLVDDTLSDKNYDLGFVDYGLHVRGDLVNLLIGRVPIVAAHDTNMTPEVYGWNIIKDRPDYLKVHYYKGQGTTFWIHRDQRSLAEALCKQSGFSLSTSAKIE
jgi:hypothetical protein